MKYGQGYKIHRISKFLYLEYICFTSIFTLFLIYYQSYNAENLCKESYIISKYKKRLQDKRHAVNGTNKCILRYRQYRVDILIIY